MREPSPHIRIHSGLGRKGPACLRLWTGHETWILDCGTGPDADAPFDPAWLVGADRVLITHDHIDHIGGAAHAIAAGLPVHCTEATARALPAGAALSILSEKGQVVIAGHKVTTGRNGHALGGVWLHVDLGAGLFYSGDWSEESRWFAFDPPPRAELALIDASYQLEETTNATRLAQLSALLDEMNGAQVLFPVPPSGRAGELALFLMARGTVSLDAPCSTAIRHAFDSGALSAEAAALAACIGRPFDARAQYLLCDTPNAESGAAYDTVQRWRSEGRLGRDASVIFTGHMTPEARGIMREGGHFLRWNVHPPLGCQIRMLERLEARRFAPLFCAGPEAYLTRQDLPAQVVLEPVLSVDFR